MSRFLPAPAALVLVALAVACTPPPEVAPAPAAPAGITAQDMYDRIYFLASDGLRGRDTPSPGLEAAAAYLVSEHRRMGVEPGGEDGYYQRWPFLRYGVVADRARLAFRGPAAEEALAWGEDFFVAGGGEDEVAGGLLYAGTLAEVADADPLRGRVAVATLPGEWGGAFRQQASRQAAAARQVGARGVVHVLDAGWTPQAIAEAGAWYGRDRWVLPTAEEPFPQFFLRREVAEELFRAADLDLDALARAGEERPVPLAGVTLAGLPARARLERADPPNVIGIVRGSDPQLRDEYVVLSAHFDHVGVGTPMNGDSIYNGADDNASGTAALLEVARLLTSLPEAPRRSVMLVHVSGEEKGLLGSRWFADNPTVPVESMVANINIDMVAGDTHRDTVVVIGKDYSDLGELVDGVNERHPELGLVTSDDLWPEQRFFFRSDHFNFARREIPAIFFFTGVHECYHRPCDTVDFIDPGKAARVAQLAFHTAVEIANRDARPRWDPAGLEEVRRLTR